MTHPNSRAAYATLDLCPREVAIMDVFKRTRRPMTEREVLVYLNQHDMNYVRPRVTRLIKGGLLFEIGDNICKTTGRKVRILFTRPSLIDNKPSSSEDQAPQSPRGAGIEGRPVAAPVRSNSRQPITTTKLVDVSRKLVVEQGVLSL